MIRRAKALERELKDRRRANKVLRKAPAHFARAELDRRRSLIVASIDAHREVYGVEPIWSQLPIAASSSDEAKAAVVEPRCVAART